ncbi:hypothetical protein ACROYT_G013631 [Oculina patagonica]
MRYPPPNSFCKLCTKSTPPSTSKTGKGKKRQSALVPWVQCDSCDEWFHLKCVGLSKKPEKKRRVELQRLHK